MENNKKHIAIIIKYLTGGATPDEVSVLEKWVLEKEENKNLFNQYKKAWILANSGNKNENIELEKEWSNMQKRLFSENGKVVKLDVKKERKTFFLLRIAAVALVIVAAFLWFYTTNTNIEIKTAYAENGIEEINLPDGSIVTLNTGARITYPEKFDSDTRDVTLDGNAFFDVERNEKHPFVIETQGITVEVLGTSFYVNSKKSATEISVIVKSGKVAMVNNDDKIILTKGEKGIFSKENNKLREEKNDDVNFIAWKTKYFIFDDSKLSDVIVKLNEAFNKNIKLANDSLNDCNITVTFEGQSLNSILNVLKETLNLEITKNEDGILISGDGC